MTTVNQKATTRLRVPMNIMANNRSGRNTIFCRNASCAGVTDSTMKRPPKFSKMYANPSTYGFMLMSCSDISIESETLCVGAVGAIPPFCLTIPYCGLSKNGLAPRTTVTQIDPHNPDSETGCTVLQAHICQQQDNERGHQAK